MEILVVEDDHLQAEWIRDVLRASDLAQSGSVNVSIVSTESDFRAQLEKIATFPPAVVVMDVILRWCDPIPSALEPPDDVKRGKRFRAGIRCKSLLASDSRTAAIPVLLYTVLERGSLEIEPDTQSDGIEFLSKGSGEEALIEKIRYLTKRQP